jgi:hypothetical protein
VLRARILLIVVALPLFSIFISSPTHAQEACPDSPPTRLVVGDYARVLPGSANNVRETPSTAGAKVGEIPGDGIFEVLEGPVCADGYTWYRVDYSTISDDPVIGWTVETVGDEYAVEFYSLGMGNTTGYPRIQLDIPAEFDEGELTVIPTKLDSDGPWFSPERVRLEFVDPYLSVDIYPIIPFERLNVRGLRDNTIDSVLNFDRPVSELTEADLYPFIHMSVGTDIFAQVAFVDFENGRGVRHLGYLTPEFTPVFPEGLTYIFIGYTDEYYIYASTNVTTDVLEENKDAAVRDSIFVDGTVTDKYDAYIAEANAVLNAAQSTDFSTDLAILDAMFASMRLDAGQPEPELVLNWIEAPTDAPDATPTIEVGECGLRSQLEVGGLARQALQSDSLRVRDAAAGAATGQNAFPGDLMRVEDGPICAEGRNWWQVSKIDGAWMGWIAEAGDTDYFLEPIAPTPTPSSTLTPTQTVTPSPTVATNTPTPTNTLRPSLTPTLTNTPGPSPTPTLTHTPSLTPTLIAGRCRIIPIADSRLRSTPNGDAENNGFFAPANVANYADAQFNRQGEGFTWWRLAENPTVRPIPPSTSFGAPNVNWVREDFVREEGNCDNLPQVTP